MPPKSPSDEVLEVFKRFSTDFANHLLTLREQVKYMVRAANNDELRQYYEYQRDSLEALAHHVRHLRMLTLEEWMDARMMPVVMKMLSSGVLEKIDPKGLDLKDADIQLNQFNQKVKGDKNN